jgi:hypothetical protein
LKENKEKKRERTEGWKGGKKNKGHPNQAHLEGSLMLIQVWDVFRDTSETAVRVRVQGGLNNAVSHVHAVLEQREDLGRWVEEGGGIECLREFYDEL